MDNLNGAWTDQSPGLGSFRCRGAGARHGIGYCWIHTATPGPRPANEDLKSKVVDTFSGLSGCRRELKSIALLCPMNLIRQKDLRSNCSGKTLLLDYVLSGLAEQDSRGAYWNSMLLTTEVSGIISRGTFVIINIHRQKNSRGRVGRFFQLAYGRRQPNGVRYSIPAGLK